MFAKEIYVSRRRKLKKQVASGIILIPGAYTTPYNSPDNCYPFRQESNFLYLTGIDEPDLFLVMDVDSGEDCLFGVDLSVDAMMWSGPSPTMNEFAQRAGIEMTLDSSEMERVIKKASSVKRAIHFAPPGQPRIGVMLQELLGINYHALQQSYSEELIKALIQLRSIKDEYEIKEIEAALDVTGIMYRTVMQKAFSGVSEQEIKGLIEGIAIAQGGGVPYPSIVTVRGDVLHNLKAGNILEDNQLLLVDAAAESQMGYASDITRTIPVNRQFTRRQQEIYEIVLQVNQEAISTVKPGLSFKTVHLQAALSVAKGLGELGLMKGDLEEAVELGAHALFFPHGLGHMLGLDVHDMENLGEDYIGYDETVQRSNQFGLNHLRLAKTLETGFVITVEPGIYFIRPLIERWCAEKRFESFINYKQVQKYLDFGGIRIEDNVLITATGSKVLGKPIPKSVQEVQG